MTGGRFDRLGHLVRRFRGSLSPVPPSEDATRWAHSQLLPEEIALWEEMCVQDRRHSVEVARRFSDSLDSADRNQTAGALLHDVGKIDSGLGTFGRVVATVVGPRTSRFTSYHDHERIGAKMAIRAGSSPVTVDLISGRGPTAAALRDCDDV